MDAQQNREYDRKGDVWTLFMHHPCFARKPIKTFQNLILALLKRHGFAEHQILDVPFDPNSISNNLSGPSRNISLHPILKHSKTPMEEFQVLGQKIRDITQLNKVRDFILLKM